MPTDLNAFRNALRDLRGALRSGDAPTRSGSHVAPVHRYVARELVRHGIPVEWVAPNPFRDDGAFWSAPVAKVFERLVTGRPLRHAETQAYLRKVEAESRRKRRTLLGAYHQKEVDVSAVAEDVGPLMVVSVKAPTSSVAKNMVNRYEEGIGEATNLHTRFPMLIFGFLMILPKVDELFANGAPTPAFERIENLMLATSGRSAVTDPPGSYEAAALVLVNNAVDPPAILADVPSPDSPLRIERFFDSLFGLHAARNRGLRV